MVRFIVVIISCFFLAFDTAFEQSGILRVSSMAELFDIGFKYNNWFFSSGLSHCFNKIIIVRY